MQLELSTKELDSLKNLLKESMIFFGRDKEQIRLNAEEFNLFMSDNINEIESINQSIINQSI